MIDALIFSAALQILAPMSSDLWIDTASLAQFYSFYHPSCQ